MNVFDFDGTIYKGDSSIDFWVFCLKKKKSLIRFLPIQLLAFVLYKLGLVNKKQLKSYFFSFLRGLSFIDEMVGLFWDENEKKITTWYQEVKNENDCVISASPEFLLREICNRLKILNLIATDVDKTTGGLKGENCYGLRKVELWKQKYPKEVLNFFYSDSKSDVPMARLAKEAFFVYKNDIRDWKFDV